jgi:hypothetical protein
MTVNFYRNSPELAIEMTRRRKSTGPTAPALCGSLILASAALAISRRLENACRLIAWKGAAWVLNVADVWAA